MGRPTPRVSRAEFERKSGFGGAGTTTQLLGIVKAAMGHGWDGWTGEYWQDAYIPGTGIVQQPVNVEE